MAKLIVFLLFWFFVGVYGHTPLQADARESSRRDFAKDANVLFLQGDYEALVRNVETDLKRQRLGVKDKKEVLYLAGLSYINLGDFMKAREAFGGILAMRGDEFKEESLIGIADSYFREKNFDKAIDGYENVLVEHPGTSRISSVYYNLGLSYEAKKDPDKANYYFTKLKKGYEESFEANKMTDLPSPDEEAGYYVIQLGVFAKLTNAKRLVNKLSKKNCDSYIQKVRMGNGVLYRVRGGKFSNKTYAKKLLRKLKMYGFQAKIVEE